MPQKRVKNTNDVYRRVPLAAHYSTRQRLTIRLIDWTFYFLIKIIGKTIRFETEGWENFEAIERSGKTPIYAFWHNRIFLATYYFRNRGIVVMSSQSYDGEYIASFIKRFGYGVLRGSSTRGGVGALVEMIRLMRQGLPMGFTVDGPKGPKYVAKTGACLLAKKTGNPIMPFMVEAEKCWSVKNWDNLQIPKPFSRARIFIADSVFVEADANDERIEQCRLALQTKLDELVELGKQWRASTGK
jgi:lysophospholipid acyltransferase (LPLAT)-like uncharacterized protein